MRTTAVLLTLVMLTSALAGCAGSGDDTEKDEQIASLELEVANLTSENAENAENVAALQSTLEEAQIALELANEDLANISAQLSTAEWHRANLSNSLSEVMDQLNQTENDELITSLQAEIADLDSQISDADSQITNLEGELTEKENQVASLEATNAALQSTIGSLTYQIRDMIANCPQDNPGLQMVIGYDDGSGGGVPDDGELHDEEVEYQVGECPGDHSMVESFQNNSDGFGPGLLVEMGGILYFSADDGIHGWEPWRSDGTLAGTYLVKDVREESCWDNGEGGEDCENYGSLIVVCWGAVLNNNCFYPEMVAGNEKLFFTGFFTWIDSDGYGQRSSTTLFVSDGTESGTEIGHFHWRWDPSYSSDEGWGEDVAGVNQLIAIPSSQFVPDRVVYTAVEVLGGECDDCHPPTGRELWITDGTESGTTMLANLQPEDEEWVYSGTTYCCADFQGGEPRDLLKKGNTIWFSANTAEYGRELYRYGLAAVGGGLFLVEDLVEGEESSNPMYMTSGSDGVYFSALEESTGRELYHSRGDAFTTGIIKDINPGTNSSEPLFFTKLGDKIFFTADDGTNGRELWISDRTETGTFMVKDIHANGSGDPYQLHVLDGILYFMAETEEHGRELWRSDGTETGTYLVKDINPGNNSSYYWVEGFVTGTLFKINAGEMFFACDDGVHGVELCRSDGTTDGTSVAVDVNVGENSSWPLSLTSVGKKLYFNSFTEENGRQLHFFWDNPGPIISTTEDS